MKLIKHYSPRLTKQQKHWHRLLKLFGRFLDYYNTPPQDAAYWYGERALTGLLAAAAWRLNEWSLEEFTSRRSAGRQDTAGKGDAWISVGGTTFTIEAKLRWPRTMDLKNWENQIESGITATANQLKDLDADYKAGTIKTAVCYIVPEITASGYTSISKEVVRRFAKLPLILGDARTVVGTFCYPRNPPRSKHRTDSKYYVYPGVIVVARFWN